MIDRFLSGQRRGLSVILDAQLDLHVAVPRENAGFKVLLHPRDEEPNLLDFGIELDLGKHTSVRILPREVMGFFLSFFLLFSFFFFSIIHRVIVKTTFQTFHTFYFLTGMLFCCKRSHKRRCNPRMQPWIIQQKKKNKNKKKHSFHSCVGLKGCGMGPWLVLVSPCFRENIVATCKIGSFLCCLDNLLQKNVIVFFFGNQISKWRLFEKGAIFDLLFTFFSHQGKVTKIPSAHILLTYIHIFCSPY